MRSCLCCSMNCTNHKSTLWKVENGIPRGYRPVCSVLNELPVLPLTCCYEGPFVTFAEHECSLKQFCHIQIHLILICTRSVQGHI